MGYIVTHNRDRDFYQVPLALSENNTLDYFVTDYYEGSGISIPSLQHRFNPGIPASKVIESHRAFISQMPYEILRRVKKSVDFPTLFVEKNLGKTVEKVYKENPDSDLFLYTGSAYWAFKAASHSVTKNLFVYQVAPEYLSNLLADIDELASARPWLKEAEQLNPRMIEHHHKEVQLANKAFCASTITKKSLLSEGMKEEDIVVAPYGVPEVGITRTKETSTKCKFLFAGQGISRKGLHLLVEAWRQAKLKNSTLSIVTSRTDPEIIKYAEGLENIEFLGRQNHEDLMRTMAEHDTFVMPSLVEGFGLVYGEALASGCRLIGTENTGMFDMDLIDSVGTIVKAGQIEPLVQALKKHEDTYNMRRPYLEEIYAEAERLSWKNFRIKIRQGLSTEYNGTHF